MDQWISALQWPAVLVTVSASWFVASSSRTRRHVGFWLFLLSCRSLSATWGVQVARLASRLGFFLLVGGKFLAGKLGDNGCAPGVLLAVRNIARSLLDPIIRGARMAVAGFVALVWQTRHGLTVPTRQGLTLICVAASAFGASRRNLGH